MTTAVVLCSKAEAQTYVSGALPSPGPPGGVDDWLPPGWDPGGIYGGTTKAEDFTGLYQPGRVTMPGVSQPQQVALDVGGDGQRDKVVDHSAPATLQRLAQANPSRLETGIATVGTPPRKPPVKSAQAPQAAAQPAAQAEASPPAFQTGVATIGYGHGAARASVYQRPRYQSQPAPPPAAQARSGAQLGYNPQRPRTKAQITGEAQISEPGAEPPIPGTHDANGHYLGPRPPDDETHYGAELEARSKRIFGYGSIGRAEAARQQWMAEQEQRAIANEINRKKPLIYPVSGR